MWPGCGLLFTDGCLAEDDYVPTSGGESDGESGAEKSGVDETLQSDSDVESEEEEEPVTTAKKVTYNIYLKLCRLVLINVVVYNYIVCGYGESFHAAQVQIFWRCTF